jgi:SAM-dependent methyltransferase
MWSFPGYRAVSPGEQHAQTFCQVVNLPANATVVDFGCGTGRGALAIMRATGCAVILTDFAENCRDPEAEGLPFVRADLSCDRLPVGDVGYCSDVMEHIPPHQVDTVLRNIMNSVPACFFNIDFCDDICGAMIGEKLHLSVHNSEWWMERFGALGYRVEWSGHDQRSGRFFVTH